jgi:predicted permease
MDSNNWIFIIAAYTAAWIAVIGYWIFVHRAVRHARARYEQAIAMAARAGGNTP